MRLALAPAGKGRVDLVFTAPQDGPPRSRASGEPQSTPGRAQGGSLHEPSFILHGCVRNGLDQAAFRSGIVPWSQLTPLAQFARSPRLDEVAHEGPRAIDGQNEVATEHAQIIHDRDVDRVVCCGTAVSGQQG